MPTIKPEGRGALGVGDGRSVVCTLTSAEGRGRESAKGKEAGHPLAEVDGWRTARAVIEPGRCPGGWPRE